MIIKLTVEELKELLEYQDGPFGERGFAQFMAGMCARIDEDTGEVDIDDEDIRTINKYRQRGRKRVLDLIFKRPVDEATRRFLGQ